VRAPSLRWSNLIGSIILFFLSLIPLHVSAQPASLIVTLSRLFLKLIDGDLCARLAEASEP
jgi:hypothetical protein